MLINNAAIARYGALLEQPVAELREVLEADVIGLLALSQARSIIRPAHESLLCSPQRRVVLPFALWFV